ncbi:MAG: hypothetical protein K1X35_12475 [Caulobacteraceae bacterium]|nr:hypothetical protein [Caulobacteraceae bacterium]
MAHRPLTAGEIDAAREVFGAALDYEPVRLWAQPFGFRRVFVAGRWFGRDWIVWPGPSLRPDYAAADAPLGDLATLIHELVHVWQAQQGVNLALAKLRAGDRPESYAYAIEDHTRWEDLNIEQQARAVEDEFRRRRNGRVAMLAGAAEAYRRITPFRV